MYNGFFVFLFQETFEGAEEVWKCAKPLLKTDAILHESHMLPVQN